MTIAPTQSTDGRQPALEAIRARLDQLTKSERKIAERLLAHPTDAVRLSITELAEQAQVGEATVSRFCRRLGWQGFQDLKISIATDLSPAAVTRDPDTALTEAGDQPAAVTAARQAQDLLERTARLIDQEQLSAAVRALVRARRVNLYGQGASAVTALDAQHGLIRLGIAAQCMLDTHSQAMTAALMQPGDVALSFSHSGSARDVVSAQRLARDNGAQTICITGVPRSPLAATSTIPLITASEETLVSNLRSKMVQLFVLELLLVGCAHALGAPADDALNRTTAAVVDKMY